MHNKQKLFYFISDMHATLSTHVLLFFPLFTAISPHGVFEPARLSTPLPLITFSSSLLIFIIMLRFTNTRVLLSLCSSITTAAVLQYFGFYHHHLSILINDMMDADAKKRPTAEMVRARLCACEEKQVRVRKALLLSSALTLAVAIFL